MYTLNDVRINIDAPMVVDGVQYANLRDPDLRAQLGVLEIPDPVYPDPDLFYWTENPDGSLVVTPKSAEQVLAVMKAKYLSAVQAHLDQAALLKGYDSILSACSYAGAPNVFQAEGQAFVQWRGDVWGMCYSKLAEVEAGTIPMPSLEELINLLPVLQLPT